MKRIVFLIIASLLVIGLVLPGCGSSSALIIFSITEGNVSIMRAAAGSWIEAQVGMSLEPGDRIRTGDNSSTNITFFDGSTVELDAGTEIEIASLDISEDTDSTTIILEQTIGSIIFRVTKVIDPASRYEVETPTGVVAVRGSAVQVTVSEDGTTRVRNLEGDIWVVAQGVELQIPEGQCCVIRPGEPPELIVERTTGPFLDEVLITAGPDPSAVLEQLKDGALDIYAFGLTDPALHADVLADPTLASLESFKAYYDITFNPVGPTLPGTGKLNPFSVPEFREAMHWLVDRHYIGREITDGLGVARCTCLHSAGADATERFADEIAALEATYAPDVAKAQVIVTEQMEKLGAVLEDGRWMYEGEVVEIIGLIRAEDNRKEMGEYFAALLEGLGFNVTKQCGIQADVDPIAGPDDPALGEWHFYTAGWVISGIPRDEAGNFGVFYTDLGWAMHPLWQEYENDPIFYEAAEQLLMGDYASVEERAELFGTCLPESMEDNVRMFLLDLRAFTPVRANVRVAHDCSGGLSGGYFLNRTAASNATFGSGRFGSWMWALTAHFVNDTDEPIVGGLLRVALPDILSSPTWNPVAGTYHSYNLFAIRATGDQGLQPDTRTGLLWPGRIEKAEVLAETGVPMSVTNTDWCSLTFVPEIQVPLDAWADWDAVNQRFLTVEDRFGAGGTTAKTKSVSYYPKDILEIPLHDGSTLSMGDFLLYTILQFDRAKPDSAVYDESAVAAYNRFMSQFKGVRFITDHPDHGLIVEYYSDQWQLDAELMVTTMFPFYSQGPAPWHTIALGIRAEEDGALAFSEAESATLDVEWMDFVDGPSLPILESYLESSTSANYIPYEPTMGLYVTETEAAERWSNLEEWYSDKGHFWVGSGPFYLESADTMEETIHLKRFEDYPDPMDRWLFLLEPLS